MTRDEAISLLVESHGDDVLYDFQITNGIFDSACLALCSDETKQKMKYESLTLADLRAGRFTVSQRYVLDAVSADVNAATNLPIFHGIG